MELTDYKRHLVHDEMIDQDHPDVNRKPNYQPDDLLTDQETTAYLRLAAGTLAVWRHEGRSPPYYKVGRSVRYKFSDIIRFLENQRIEP